MKIDKTKACKWHGGTLDRTVDCPGCNTATKRSATIQPDKPWPREAAQKTGGSVDYYKCHVADPVDPNARPYTAESIDIIEALGMTFAEGEAFKAIWRTCTGRMGGAVKADNKALYNAEKVEFFGARMVRAAKRSEAE
jgi:hypothetical protein